MAKRKTLVVVLGPTAVGKTDLAIRIASEFETEIISADSRQFFQELNIGVARPSDTELATVKHHFIASVSIHDSFSAGLFEREALALTDQLFLSKEIVVCAGGSGLYINALLYGLDNLPSDESVRNELNQLLNDRGILYLQQELQDKDPDYAAAVDIQNPHRIIRALEVCRISGKPFSTVRKNAITERPFDIIKIGLTAPRELIYDRINTRVDRMITAGLVEEARSVYPYRNLNSLNTVGYKELFDNFDDKISLSEAIEKIKQHTRNFAKRQLTWWKREKDIHWINVNEGTDKVWEILKPLQ